MLLKQLEFFEEKQEIVSINDIHFGYNPRSNLGDLETLKSSIQQMGLLNPIMIRNNGKENSDKKYELVCGHRRYEACRQLGYTTIPANIRTLSDEESFHLSFIDNEEREGYNPIDEARHYKKAQEQFGYSTRDLAEKYGNTHQYYKFKLELLNLPDFVNTCLQELKISEGHCRHISKLVNQKELVKRFEELFDTKQGEWDDTQQQRYNSELEKRQELQINLAQRIINDDLTVRQTENKSKGLLDEIKEWDETLEKEIEKEKEKQKILDGVYFKDSSNMEELQDNFIDLIFTSPPYFVGKEYEKNTLTFDDHLQRLYSTLDECTRVVCPGGKIVYNIGDIVTWSQHNKEGWPEEKMVMPYIVNHLREKNFVLFSRIIWAKDEPWVNSSHVTNHDGTKHAEYRVLPSWEYIFVFKNMNGTPKKRKQTEEMQSKLTKDEWKEYVTGVWNIRSVQSNEGHGAIFPDELAKRVIKMYSYKGDNVLDPYLGTGTTVKMARELGRNGYGYEKNIEFKETIMKKLTGDN